MPRQVQVDHLQTQVKETQAEQSQEVNQAQDGEMTQAKSKSEEEQKTLEKETQHLAEQPTQGHQTEIQKVIVEEEPQLDLELQSKKIE